MGAQFAMRASLSLALLALAACGGAPRPSIEADTAAVYEAFLSDYPRVDLSGRTLLQDSTVSLTEAAFDDGSGHLPRREISRGYSPEVRQAIQDLVARGRTPVRLPAEMEVGDSQLRVSPDSAKRLLDYVHAHQMHRLPDSAAVVQLSTVGFNRDRTVAVVYYNVVCGWLCGGGAAEVLRKHPSGWVAAEQLFLVVY
jgi:hypothetical protein